MQQPRLIADRENDNAHGAGWDEVTGTLTVRAEPRLGALNIWLRFRLEGLTPGETIRLDVTGLYEKAGFAPLFLSWDNGAHWSRSDEADPPHVIAVEAPALEVSRNVPYPYRRLASWAARVAHEAADSRGGVETLCRSAQGRDVPMFISDPLESGVPLVWVQARSHAFESHTSHVAEALVDWLLGEEGRALRERAKVCVVPMIDVDAVAVGSAGKRRTPHDPNRDYVLDAYPQTRAIKRRLHELTRAHPLGVFIDVHSPWFHNSSHWVACPEAHERVAAMADEFSSALERIDAAKSWGDRVRDYSYPYRQADLQHLGSAVWVGRQWPQAISATMEVAHDRDADGRSITTEALADYGRALGMCLAQCLSKMPV